MKSSLSLALLSVSMMALVPSFARADSASVSACAELSCGLGMDAVNNVNFKFDKENQIDVTVRELGGGDPAMNGNHLYLTLANGMADAKSFDLEINILDVKKIDVKNGTITITGSRNTIDADGEIKTEAASYKVTYGLKNGEIPASVTVASGK